MSNESLIVSAMIKTQPVLSLSVDADGSYKTWIKQQGARVDLYRNYERGNHRSGITPQMRKMLRLPNDDTGMDDFNHNYMSIVVSKFASRLHVNEISIGDDAQNKAWLNPLLEYNHWTALQGTTFRGAIRDGDSFIMVDPETLAWTSEPAYDGYSGVFALFDNNASTPYWACRIWSEASEVDQKEVMRVVVYESDKVSYWRGEENGQELRPDNIVETEKLRMQNIDLKNIPLVDIGNGMAELPEKINSRPWPVSMIPVVHFVNRYDNYSDGGESELRSGISLQDVLNRTSYSKVIASELSAFRQIWSKGIAIDVNGVLPGAVHNLILKDVNGNPIDPTPEATAFLAACAVGQFEGTDISQYIGQIDQDVREISQITETPIYGITTQGALSGEALKQLEIGLIGKCERFQHQNEDAIRDLIRLTAEIQTEMQTQYKGVDAPTFKVVIVSWKSPEILDVSARVTTLSQLRRDCPNLWSDDWYRAKIGGLLGMTQAEIAEEGLVAKNETQFKTDLIIGGGDSGTATQV